MTDSDTDLFDPVRGESDPDRYWSTTNTAEATPLVLTPLCWSVWGDGLESAWLRSMGDFGVLSRAEQLMSMDMNDRSTAAIYGRQAVNVDVLRRVLARLPGVDPDAVERDLLGSVRPGLPRAPRRPARIPIVAAKLPIALLRLHERHARMTADQFLWWRAEVYGRTVDDTVPTGNPLDRLHEAAQRFATAMHVHSLVRFLLPGAEGMITDLGTRYGAGAAARAALGGFGDVTETAMADLLWEVAAGRRTVADFLSEFGFHGPNEGNIYTRSWREDPAPVHKLVQMYRTRPDMQHADDRSRRNIAKRRQAERDLLAAVPWHTRGLLRFMLARAAGLTRKLELSKAAYLMALDGCRAAARDLGARLVRAGRLDEVEDVFFLTVEELDRLDDDGCPRARRLIRYRRDQRVEYERMRLPVAFTGMPKPVLDPAAAESSARDEPLVGKASGGGVVRGRARVLTDPTCDVDLDESDILVCSFTDPSWTPLMSLAAALVIDIGSQSSHGAVVARELGIPYVIGTEVATRVIRDGDQLLVDGDAGTVRIVATSESVA
ncbi:phosphoenolpyruvate-utilizing protein [Nocardia farcinica]|uniref:PEP-utilizing enzyme n=2 Tax=Nocardia farcinica TaxID=37329 RepID=UPI000A3CC417|nr:PEP-utilizing enzyme [Nocardia farcinica]MBA4857529.1 phosphoenolpyruvate-utilizing protein [Nocardia farcinica]MBC9816172.1 phosphoenolpyruvate-utilizing protein [Nocardia farcinica]MBF6072403.1 phosphoenolpyruvate-utilizing protein [Nocardia farcinica]MBF6262425.1 phosphoenolpyruvate-utilizing protein [Nocardia farcinica]MBF6280965.1 phosphoenolpyruvate-utilizing protein [Nocardia farcinica]